MSPMDFWLLNGGFLRSSFMCSCKLALRAMWGVVGGGSGGGGGGGRTELLPFDKHGSEIFV